MLATILMLGTYVLVSFAIQAFAGFGTTGIGLNNPQNANDALSILGDPVVGRGLAVVLLLAISSSSLASVMTCLAPTARCMLAMAVYRALPQRFARVHPQYRTPWFAVLVIGVGGFTIYLVMTLVSQNSLADMVASLGLAVDLLLRHHRVCVRVDLPAHAAAIGTPLLAAGCPSAHRRGRDDVGVRAERNRHVRAGLRQDPLWPGRRCIRPGDGPAAARHPSRGPQRTRQPGLLPRQDP